METLGNISPKQERLIIFLLNERTIEEACRKAGVGISTHWRWARDERFLNRYRDARRGLLENTVSRLQAIANSAVDALERNLTCKNPSVEVRSAAVILEHAIRGLEAMDIDVRLKELEAIIASKNNE
jgi:hypothetical protein